MWDENFRRFLHLALMVAFFASSSPSSAQSPCDGTNAAARRWGERALAHAKKHFRSAQLPTKAPFCLCVGRGHDCHRKWIPLQPLEWRASGVAVLFTVSMAVHHDSRATEEGSSKKRKAQDRRNEWPVYPFASGQQAQQAAIALWRNAALSGLRHDGRAIHCTVSAVGKGVIVPVGVQYFCSSARNPEKGAPREGVVELFTPQLHSPAIIPSYSVPDHMLSDDLPGWRLARARPIVARFVESHKRFRVKFGLDLGPHGGARMRSFWLEVSDESGTDGLFVALTGATAPEHVTSVSPGPAPSSGSKP
jgi:hypothetical protein